MHQFIPIEGVLYVACQSAFNVLFGRGSLAAFWPKILDIGGPNPPRSLQIAILAEFWDFPAAICLPSAALWPLNAYWAGGGFFPPKVANISI